MTVKQEEKLNVVFLLFFVVFATLRNYNFFKIHFIIEGCIMIFLLAGMTSLAYRKLLREKRKGESSTKYYIIFGAFVFAIVLYIAGMILKIIGYYEL